MPPRTSGLSTARLKTLADAMGEEEGFTEECRAEDEEESPSVQEEQALVSVSRGTANPDAALWRKAAAREAPPVFD
jgi:hypothetical protein